LSCPAGAAALHVTVPVPERKKGRKFIWLVSFIHYLSFFLIGRGEEEGREEERRRPRPRPGPRPRPRPINRVREVKIRQDKTIDRYYFKTKTRK
jgi:hypothetical protein